MYRYAVNLIKVFDGDTIDVDVDLGFGMVYKKQRVRLMGIDTPESRTRDLEEKFYGLASKEHLKSLLKDQKLQLVSHDKGKFGRIIGEIFIGNSTFSINQQMIQEYHAVPYFGQSKDDVKQLHEHNRKQLFEKKGLHYS